MAVPLASIEVSGFRSVASLTFDLSSTVTLLIGANGAGKSNLINAFELLGYTIDGRLAAHVVRSGGFSQLLHRAPRADSAESVSLTVWGAWNHGFRNGYRMTLTPGVDDTAILAERTYTQQRGYDWAHESVLEHGTESALSAKAAGHPATSYLLDVLAGCRVFHFDDTSPDAPPLRRVDVGDSEMLHSDGRNLAAMLLDMRINHEVRYAQIRRSIRNVAPFFDDFVLRPNGDTVLLRWRERGIDDVFSGSALSSGTLRFICLSVLLQQPQPPATIVLDEPELGLHPAAIHQLAELLRTVGARNRVVAATQSVTLLGQFGVDEVAVVERRDGATVVTRPDRDQLAEWLSDYSLGELWEMNLLGGRPGGAPRVVGT
ncbi:MAG: AAA family ATPase [Micropruina sp.]|uniref:AAA family ATPase n=1 Tax=Micropruina sp. TaxID=2737536 RepID=UPI0039E30060